MEVLAIVRENGTDLAIHAMPMRAKVPTAVAGGVTMAKKTYGRTASGKVIDDALVERLAKEAEDGFDVDELIRRRGGRPAMGSAAASVESVRLDPELSQALRSRAESEGNTNSEVIREALRRYLGLS